jgi:MFS transporter, DHA1 family, inner membrane transport protein
MSDTAAISTRPSYQVAPDGLLASVLLAFLASAGLFYVNIMAAIVAGLKDGLGIAEADAGIIGSANVYGAAFGAFMAVFAVRRLAWRPVAVVSLVTLIAIDLISTQLRTADLLIPVRFAHGFIGGWLVGIAFGVIARTKTPDRTFGMLLVVQFGLGGLGVMYLPGLVPTHGPQVLFLSLAAFSLATLAMTVFLPNYPVASAAAASAATTGARIRFVPLAASLLALFLFQAGNMALGAYIIGLGRKAGLEGDFISNTLGIASWVGAAGAVLVVFMGTTFGRFWPLAVALVLTVVGNWAFHYSHSEETYFIANVGTAITWAFVVPYLLGMGAAFDKAGRTAALAGFFSKMGLATGPFAGAYLLDGVSYDRLIDISVLVLLASAFAALGPAAELDRSNS